MSLHGIDFTVHLKNGFTISVERDFSTLIRMDDSNFVEHVDGYLQGAKDSLIKQIKAIVE